MQILIIDPNPHTRELLAPRIEEAVRQVGLKRMEMVAGDYDLLHGDYSRNPVIGIFLGPGCYEGVEQATALCKATFPQIAIAFVLENELYTAEALELRRLLPLRIMALADIAQMAAFVLDCENLATALPGGKNRGIISFLQLKGGVGASTLAAAFASCWARHDLSVALVDLDDVNPQITDWARVGQSQRKAVTETLRAGEVPRHRINELLHPVEGYDSRLMVVPQPERYRESFHFKADVLEGAPSSFTYINSLMTTLREEFDVIVVDAGRSWGISTFALLPLSQHSMLVTDDDGLSIRRTFDNLKRFVSESDDPQEFELSRWSIMLNAYSGKLISPKDLAAELQELDLFPDTSVLYTVPFCERGRQWGSPGQSFYDLAEPAVQDALAQVAFNIVPFKREPNAPLYGRLVKQLQRLVAAS